MSFLTEVTFRRMATAVPRLSATAVAPRVTAVSVYSSLQQQHNRHLSSSSPRSKTATETAKDALKSVDRVVSDKLVDGINIGSTVANKVKEAGQDIAGGKATGKAEALRDDAASKAQGLKQDAQAKTREAADQAGDKAQQAAREVKKRV